MPPFSQRQFFPGFLMQKGWFSTKIGSFLLWNVFPFHLSAEVAQSNAVSPAPNTTTLPVRRGREDLQAHIPGLEARETWRKKPFLYFFYFFTWKFRFVNKSVLINFWAGPTSCYFFFLSKLWVFFEAILEKKVHCIFLTFGKKSLEV